MTYFGYAGLAEAAHGFPPGSTGKSFGHREEWLEVTSSMVISTPAGRATSSADGPGRRVGGVRAEL